MIHFKKISQKTVYILLILIMVAGVIRFCHGFFVEKQGTHSDEEWSFGLANSYYEPYIYSSDDDAYEKNCNEWISGDVLKNYLTVQEDERFSIGSVFYNMSCDTHPPLYFIILNFLSSFFVDRYIEALGLIINLIAYIVLSIYLFKSIRLITKSNFVGLIGVLFNTFTIGTLSMTIYIRMYAMSAMFAVMLAYMNLKIYYYDESRKKMSTYIQTGIITLCGVLTHHFFLPYAFIITAIMCICWMIKKEWKVFVKYSLCMLIGVILSIVIFPATLDHLFGVETFTYKDSGNYTSTTKENYDEYINSSEIILENENNNTVSDVSNNISWEEQMPNYKWNIFQYYVRLSIEYIFEDQIGFSPITPYNRGYIYAIPIILIIVIFILIAVSFLCRKETWFINLKSSFKLSIAKLPYYIKICTKNFNWSIFGLICSILFIICITAKQVNMLYMGAYSTRYLFIIYPIFNILLIVSLYTLCSCIFKKSHQISKVVTAIILICVIVLTNIFNNSIYLWKTNNNTQLLSDIAYNSDVIIITSNEWLLTTYAPFMYNANNVFFTTYEDFWGNTDNLLTDTDSDNIYLIIDTSYLDEASSDNSETNSESELAQNEYGINNVYEFMNIANKNMQEEISESMDKNEYLACIESILGADDPTYIGEVNNFSKELEIYKFK